MLIAGFSPLDLSAWAFDAQELKSTVLPSFGGGRGEVCLEFYHLLFNHYLYLYPGI